MTTGDSQAVLELSGASPPAVVHSAGESARELSPSLTKNGLCHSLLLGQAASLVAGVNLQNSILPGEVVR